jgi:antitoxin VapB
MLIRDKEVEELALRLLQVSAAPNLDEAIKPALRREIERIRRHKLLMERIAPALALADAMGPTNPQFDMKAFSDAECGES